MSSTYGLRAHSNIAHDTCPTGLATLSPVADTPSGACSQRERPSASATAAMAGFPDASPPGASNPRSAGSSEGFTPVHSPDVFLFDPADGAGGDDFAEVSRTSLHPRNHA